jgi:hypothetical protein
MSELEKFKSEEIPVFTFDQSVQIERRIHARRETDQIDFYLIWKGKGYLTLLTDIVKEQRTFDKWISRHDIPKNTAYNWIARVECTLHAMGLYPSDLVPIGTFEVKNSLEQTIELLPMTITQELRKLRDRRARATAWANTQAHTGSHSSPGDVARVVKNLVKQELGQASSAPTTPVETKFDREVKEGTSSSPEEGVTHEPQTRPDQPATNLSKQAEGRAIRTKTVSSFTPPADPDPDEQHPAKQSATEPEAKMQVEPDWEGWAFDLAIVLDMVRQKDFTLYSHAKRLDFLGTLNEIQCHLETFL